MSGTLTHYYGGATGPVGGSLTAAARLALNGVLSGELTSRIVDWRTTADGLSCSHIDGDFDVEETFTNVYGPQRYITTYEIRQLTRSS